MRSSSRVISPLANHAVYTLRVTTGCCMKERSIVCLNASKFLAAIDLSQCVGRLWLRPPTVRVGLVLERPCLLGERQRTEGIDHDSELIGRRFSDRPFVGAGMRPMR